VCAISRSGLFSLELILITIIQKYYQITFINTYTVQVGSECSEQKSVSFQYICRDEERTTKRNTKAKGKIDKEQEQQDRTLLYKGRIKGIIKI